MIRGIEIFCPWCQELVHRNLNIPDLCMVFNWAAIRTWKNMRDHLSLKTGVNEDSITDDLLFQMTRRARHLAYKRFNRTEEGKDYGADWLWWFVSENRGFPILVQAKRLFDGNRYKSMKPWPRGAKQTKRLLASAEKNGWLPLYCFYNFWDSIQHWDRAPGNLDSPYWGCTVASAQSIKELLQGSNSNANSLDSVGPLSYPWMHLVCPVAGIEFGPPPRNLPEYVRRRARSLLNLENVPEVVPLPSWVLQFLDKDVVGEMIHELPEEVRKLKGMFLISGRRTDSIRWGPYSSFYD